MLCSSILQRLRRWIRLTGASLLGASCIGILALTVARAAPPPLRYLLDLRQPESHRVRVTMIIPEAAPATQIQLPAWNNLYQMRDFVRNVRDLKAWCDGSGMKLARRDRNTWQSGRQACSELQVRYSVRAQEESPFSSALNEQHAFLNFALLLFYVPQERARSVRVKFLLPAGWKLATLLEEEKGEFKAAHYDDLVDRPAEAGHFADYSYVQGLEPGSDGQNSARSAEYRVIVHSDGASYSAERLLASLQKITAAGTALMRDLPFPRYTFILHFQRRGVPGGMEHRYGTAISVNASRLEERWHELEEVLAHEFFHLWNVKRIRPQALEPVDHIRGNDTRDLWFSEGVTSYYQELLLLRAGMINRETFYARLAGEIGRLEARPARHSQSAEQSGRDAWLEKYRSYNRPKRSISYYNKGALLGLLLDLRIRHATRNCHSLDDLMRRLNSDFAQSGRFFTQADLRSLVAELAPAFRDVEAFFPDFVSGTRELDYNHYLGFVGLRLMGVTGNGKRVEDPLGLDSAGTRRRDVKAAYRVEEIANPTADQLRIREGWLAGKAG